MVSVVNRSVVIVKPQQPFVDWANALADSGLSMTLEEYRYDSTAYLFPDIEGDEPKERLLRRHHKFIFENELSSWNTNESSWPIQRSYGTFLKWFEVEFHSIVIDLHEASIIEEEL